MRTPDARARAIPRRTTSQPWITALQRLNVHADPLAFASPEHVHRTPASNQLTRLSTHSGFSQRGRTVQLPFFTLVEECVASVTAGSSSSPCSDT